MNTKNNLKLVCRWIGVGTIAMFFIFCTIKASHLRHLAAAHFLQTDHIQSTITAKSVAPKTKAKPLIKAKSELSDSMPQPDSHIMAIARDQQGNIWIGTEEDGVFRCDPSADSDSQWSQFTTNNGLGDNNAYTIACDKQGRIWVGELNHGVSVFNGEIWKNYDIFDGPIGERVFRIAVCPTDGDVWMATSAGLTRYSSDLDTWRYYTRADGLPSDQANSLAFDAKGNLYVGTQCDGIAIGSAVGGYKQWTIIPGPAQLPTTPLGTGLPSGQINDLLVTRDQQIYAATTAGLAFSTNSGKDWQYIRGWDYAAKVRGFTGDTPPDDWQPMSKVNLGDLLLPEDYVTCLAEDKDTNIWLGFRMQGYAVLSSKADKILFHNTQRGGWLTDNYVTAILPGEDFKGYAGSYGGGLMMPETSTNSEAVQENVQSNTTTIFPLPRPAKPPTLDELNFSLKEINAVLCNQETSNPVVIPVEDDWLTEGQWQGRYGKFWIVLCANWSPRDDIWGAGWDVMYDARIGLNRSSDDLLRYWVQWLFTGDNRCLEMSPVSLQSQILKNKTTWNEDRRESEWDDHGEVYPMNKNGPHIYCSLTVPPGLFYLSLYEVNPNGHESRNRFRDYRVSIRPHPGRSSLDFAGRYVTINRSFFDIKEFNQKPEWANARVQNFWGGVYKRFLVRGPVKLTIEVNRNNSFNTILPGVMLDLVDELPPPYFQTRQEWEQKQAQLVSQYQTNVNQSQGTLPAWKPATSEEEAARQLFGELQQLQLKNEAWWAINKRRFYLTLLRWYLKQNDDHIQSTLDGTASLATCDYQLGLYQQWEENLKKIDIVPMRVIEKDIGLSGIPDLYAGKDYEAVTNYLTTHSMNWSRRNATVPNQKALEPQNEDGMQPPSGSR